MKREYFFVILFLIFAMFLVGCADTTLNTIKNPELSQNKIWENSSRCSVLGYRVEETN